MAFPTAAPRVSAAAGRTRTRLTTGYTQARTTTARFKAVTGVPGALALCALLFSNIVGQVIQRVLTTPALLAVGLAVVGTGTLVTFARWNRRFGTATTGPAAYGQSGTDRLPQRRGLVLVCGLDSAAPDSATAALLRRLPNLDYLAMVGTPQTSARGVPAGIVDRLLPVSGHHLAPAQVRVWDFGNAASISDFEESTTEAIRWLLARGLTPEEIVVDVSAGRRPMIYGAKDAADELLVETQYLAEEWDVPTNSPVPGTKHFKVIKTFG